MCEYRGLRKLAFFLSHYSHQLRSLDSFPPPSLPSSFLFLEFRCSSHVHGDALGANRQVRW